MYDDDEIPDKHPWHLYLVALGCIGGMIYTDAPAWAFCMAGLFFILLLLVWIFTWIDGQYTAKRFGIISRQIEDLANKVDRLR